MIIQCRLLCGGSIARRCEGSAAYQRWSNGTIRYLLLKNSLPKQIARVKSRVRYSVPAPSLHEVQRLFWESIAVRPGRDSIAPAFVRLVRGCDDSDRKTRIRVYSDAYYLRLRDVLREDFPRVAALLGADQFDEVVKGYLEVFPSEMAVGPSPGPCAGRISPAPGRHAQSAWPISRNSNGPASRFSTHPTPSARRSTTWSAFSPNAWPSLRFSTIPAIQILRAQYPVHQLWSGERVAGRVGGRDLAPRLAQK